MDENYQIFLENENEIALAYGRDHLYLLVRHKELPDRLLDYLPSDGTLGSFINPNKKSWRRPTNAVIRQITDFFKEAFCLPYKSLIDNDTLKNHTIEEILSCQGIDNRTLKELCKENHCKTDLTPSWLIGKYYFYYQNHPSKSDVFSVNGGALWVLASTNWTFDAVLITGLQCQSQLDYLCQNVLKKADCCKKRFSDYISGQIDDTAVTGVFYWRGSICRDDSFIEGSFRRDDITGQKMEFFLYSPPTSNYKKYVGGIGVQLISPDKNNVVFSSKILISRKAQNWDSVSNLFETKFDNDTFLSLIENS